MMVRVKYTCHGCGLTQVEVEVPARGDEDVITWLEQTQKYIGQSHRRQSPLCWSQTCDVMIPMTGTPRVGAAPLQ